MFVSERNSAYLLVFLAPHTYLHYRTAEKKKLGESLRLEEVGTPVYFVFVGLRYLQHIICG